MQCPLERQSTAIECGQQCNGFTVNTTILHPQSVDISKSFVQLGGFLALLLLDPPSLLPTLSFSDVLNPALVTSVLPLSSFSDILISTASCTTPRSGTLAIN